jgi:hypothetical protein
MLFNLFQPSWPMAYAGGNDGSEALATQPDYTLSVRVPVSVCAGLRCETAFGCGAIEVILAMGRTFPRPAC